MRLSLIRYAEIYAKQLLWQFGDSLEHLSITEGAEEFLEDQGTLHMPDANELAEFIDYVDYLCTNAKIIVELPKTRL